MNSADEFNMCYGIGMQELSIQRKFPNGEKKGEQVQYISEKVP